MSIMEFKVAFKSSNTNSFGLRQMILMSRKGISYKVCANSLNEKPQGAILTVPMNGKIPNFSTYGFELIEKISLAPPKEVLESIWK